jgi:hypothetical protein
VTEPATSGGAGRLRRAQLRWRLTGLPLRLAIQAAAGAAIGIAVFAVLRTNDTIDATAASVLVAVFFGIFTVFQQRQAQRRQHTVELITAFQTSDQLSAADKWMVERITNARPVEVDVSPDDEGHVVVLLDYYEFLAVLAQRGMVDVPLLMDLRGGAMARCFRMCETYIDDRRLRVRTSLYFGLDMFVAAYTRRAAP